MMRALTLSCALLLALCAFQWKAIRDLKGALAQAATQSDSRCVTSRGDELSRTLLWLDEQLNAAPDGSGGLCRGGRIDGEAVKRLVVDTYLLRRAGGASELEARDELLRTVGPSRRVR